MIVTINSVEQRFATNGAEYRYVQGTTDKGHATTKIVFEILSDKWGLLVEGDTVEFIMKQEGYKDGKAIWNVADILPVSSIEPEEEPAQFYKQPEPAPAPMPKKGTQIPKTGTPPTPAEAPPKTEKALPDERTRDIHRQVALKCATELACHGLIKLGELKEKAEMLLRYLDE